MPRVHSTCLAALVAVALTLPVAAAGQNTLMTYVSEEGDSIGNGPAAGTFAETDGTFTALRNVDGGVRFGFDGGGINFWTTEFSNADATDLLPGDYPDAQRYPFQDPGHPGLSASAMGSGCNESGGHFIVHEAQYDGVTGDVTSFAADLVHWCQHAYGPAPGRLVQAVRFNAPAGYEGFVDVDADTSPDIVDNCQGLENPDQRDSDLDDLGDLCDPTLSASFAMIDREPYDDPDFGRLDDGERRHWNTANARIRVRRNVDDGITVELESATLGDVDVTFAAADDSQLGVGSYPDPAVASATFSNGDSVCFDLSRSFEIFEVEYDADGNVTLFSADVHDECNLASNGDLDARIRFRAGFRPAQNDVDGDGWLDKDDNCEAGANPPQYDDDMDGVGDGCPLPISTDHQRCIYSMNKAGAGVVKAQSKDALSCMKAAQKGATTTLGASGTAQGCLGDDVKGKVLKARDKLRFADPKVCDATDLPPYGYTGEAAAGTAAQDAASALVGDLFGPDLDAVLVDAATDTGAAKCQQELLKKSQVALDNLMKLMLKRKKNGMKGKIGPLILSGETLAEAVTRELEDDPTGKGAKKFASLASGLAKKCAAVDLAATFPQCAPADTAGLAACAEQAVRCRFCQAFAGMDGAAMDCDALDDGDGANGSCS